MKRVIILDLDNTLIYSTYDGGLKVNRLFKYMDFLYIYERPYARKFIQRCHEVGDVVIFTISEMDYATQVSEHLNIQPIGIYANEHCLIRENVIRKSVPDHFFDVYDEIVIVDDYPEIWDVKIHDRCRFIIPFGFMGDERDCELKLSMDRLVM